MELKECKETIAKMNDAIGLVNEKGYTVQGLIPAPKGETDEVLKKWYETVMKNNFNFEAA